MGVDLSQQLTAFLLSWVLGALLGVVFDLLRVLYPRSGWVRSLLDGVFCLFAGACIVAFMLQPGDGELRVYMLAGIAGGALLYLWLFSPLLRPLWGFWQDVAGDCIHFFLAPLLSLLRLIKKFAQKQKKHFLFLKKWFTIIRHQRWMILIRRKRTGGEAIPMGRSRRERKERKRKKKSGGLLGGLILLVLLFGLGFQLYRMQDQLAAARAEESALAEQITALQEENTQLEENIARSNDPEMIEKIAREDLGMVVQDEKVFYTIGG